MQHLFLWYILEEMVKSASNIRKLALAVVFAVSLSFQSAPVVYADALSDRLTDVTSSTDETSFIQSVVRLSVPVAVFALVGISVYSGYIMLTSQGNPEKLNEARDVITNGVIGFALIALSVAILLLIQNVLKLPGVTP